VNSRNAFGSGAFRGLFLGPRIFKKGNAQ
jgi:hypothetical protein